MIKSKIIKSVIFCTFFVVLFQGVFRVLWFRDNVYSTEVFNQFYELPDNCVDAVFIGPSSVHEYWIADEAFHNYGITVYPLATGNQPFGVVKYLIQEAEKTQDPSLFLIDIRILAYGMPKEAEMRAVTDSMKFSLNRIRAIDYMLEQGFKDVSSPSKTPYYFSFLKYHSRWKNLSAQDFGVDLNCFMGYTIFSGVHPFQRISEETLSLAPMQISEYSEKVLVDTLEYCKSLDKEVLFTCSPHFLKDEYFAQYNYVKKLIKSNGFKVFDTNYHTDDMQLNYTYDVRNASHVNAYGARKYTNYLAKYLQSNYNLPDHRNDAAYSFWEEDYKRFENALISYAENLYQYLGLVNNDRYSVLIAVRDEASNSMNEDITIQMRQLGLDIDLMGQVQKGYLAVIDHGEAVFESIAPDLQTPLSFSGTLTDGPSFQMFSSGYHAGNRASIIIDGQECAINKRGLNFVVYDHVTAKVIDKVCFDSWAPDIPAYR
ncbi:hypothetical protein [Harryflintia acetispora]|uniref:hypothetical protein n=1 Tax=Harryflintia acetispora TaxID=1849041 RepID=UPI00189813E7|nr:hypothetical protein [Harryflintia acetispora]